MGNFQKLVFLHTQKVLFHTLKNNVIPYIFLETQIDAQTNTEGYKTRFEV